MNFLKLLVFSISFHLTVSIYSFSSQNIDQERFEYKDIFGQKYMLHRRTVELHMDKKIWILGAVFLNGVEFFIFEKNKITAILVIAMTDWATYKVMNHFCQQAGPWLKALQEKEALLKNSQTSDSSARAGAPSDPLINKGSTHN